MLNQGNIETGQGDKLCCGCCVGLRVLLHLRRNTTGQSEIEVVEPREPKGVEPGGNTLRLRFPALVTVLSLHTQKPYAFYEKNVFLNHVSLKLEPLNPFNIQ